MANYVYSSASKHFVRNSSQKSYVKTITSSCGENLTFNSHSLDNGWFSSFLGGSFSSCLGCGQDDTEVTRRQHGQLYESSFIVEVVGPNNPNISYQWQVRLDRGTSWTEWQNITEDLEFTNATTSSLEWRYPGAQVDRRMALRCIINNGQCTTKPIYYRYAAVPGDIGYPPTPTPNPVPTATPTSQPTATPTSQPTATPASTPTSPPSTPEPTPPPTYGSTPSPTPAPTYMSFLKSGNLEKYSSLLNKYLV